MSADTRLPSPPSRAASAPAALVELELTASGHVRMGPDVAASVFPGDALVARALDDGCIALVALRGTDGGGLYLKQCSAAGDRAVLLTEVLPVHFSPGPRLARWYRERGELVFEVAGHDDGGPGRGTGRGR